jgi:GxxExxY protein
MDMNEGRPLLTQKYLSEISHQIIGCAIEVHNHLGPGLLESIYHSCLVDELNEIGLDVKSQVALPVRYKDKELGNLLRIDLLVNDGIIVEIKAVEEIIPVHKAQLLSYLKIAGKPKGLLINFHSPTIVSQLVSMVTDQYANLPKE